MEKVQCRAARFVKRNYRSTKLVSSFISQLGWQTLSDHRRNSRLSHNKLSTPPYYCMVGVKTAITCSLIPILSPPGFSKNVHLSLSPQSLILSICHSPPVSSTQLSVSCSLLKKSTLDKDQLSNYYPVSNLSLISKITECVVKSRLTDHLTSNKLLNRHQSAYCKHYSTETALLYIHSHLVSAIGSQKLSCLFQEINSFGWYNDTV